MFANIFTHKKISMSNCNIIIIILILFCQKVSADSSCKADVVFLMDNTGSMGSTISATKRNAKKILESISGSDERFTGIDVNYGVATYWGDPLEYTGDKTTDYHCPSSKEYKGPSNKIILEAGVTYSLDMIDVWGDGWNGSIWNLKSGGTTFASVGSEFTWGRYKSGGEFSVANSGQYEVTINPWSDGWPYWSSEVRWRFCKSDSSDSSSGTGYPEIAQKSFKVNQAITPAKEKIISAMGEWSTCSSPGGCGGDWPEGNYFALHQLATGGGFTDGKCPEAFTGTCSDMGFKTGSNINWRENAGKVIVWFGDARSHCSTVDIEEATNALLKENIAVAAINTKNSNYGIDTKYSCTSSRPSSGQSSNITEITKGVLTNNVSGSDATVNAILDAVSKSIAQIGSGAAVTFSTSSLTENTQLFQTSINSTDWSGDVVAYNLNNDGVIGPPLWSASTELKKKNPDQRLILTSNKNKGVPFLWSSISDNAQNDLMTNSSGKLENKEIGQARLNYLRGDQSNEDSLGFGFRSRSSVLGDIWHSSAVFVGMPNQNWPDSGEGFPGGENKYSLFSFQNTNRIPMVYAGANDGFLHGFDARDGSELIAYAPENLFSDEIGSGYHALTDPNFNHSPLYVDSTPIVSDAYIKTTLDSTARWHTILIGSQGGGGRGLFALDVTSPSPSSFQPNNADNLVLWEFNNTHNSNLGYTYSKPIIGLMNNGRWAVLTGNGLGGTNNNEKSVPQLFIIYLDGGLDGTWTEGQDYLRIETNTTQEDTPNGLFSPAIIDLDNNGTVDYVYAGDNHGNLWAFNFSDASDSSWSLSYGSNPLFSGNLGQPITVEPTIIRHPTVSSAAKPNVLILFGTGRFLSEADKTLNDIQSFYAIWDIGQSNLNRLNLEAQNFLLNNEKGRVTDSNLEISYNSISNKKYGWYLDLPTTGERVTSNSLVRENIVYFNSVIPERSVCASGGTGWEMSLKTVNGGSPDNAVFDYNDDGVVKITRSGGDEYPVEKSDQENFSLGYAGRIFDAEKGMPAGSSIIGNRRFTPGSSTKGGDEIVDTELASETSVMIGRTSWEQIFPD